MKKFVKRLVDSIKKTEFTKKWIARFTVVVFVLLLFYPILCEELLYFHFRSGLSTNLIKIVFSQYTSFAKVLVTGYAVVFITQMGKAFLSKQQEEANKVKLKLQDKFDGCECEIEETEEDI